MNGYAEYYIKDDKSEGFTKTFDGNCYGFAAIMPNEGVSIEDYIKSMTCKNLINMPKFSCYTINFEDIFKGFHVKTLNLFFILMILSAKTRSVNMKSLNLFFITIIPAYYC